MLSGTFFVTGLFFAEKICTRAQCTEDCFSFSFLEDILAKSCGGVVGGHRRSQYLSDAELVDKGYGIHHMVGILFCQFPTDMLKALLP